MKRFKFRLDAYLSLKEHEKGKATEAYAAVLAKKDAHVLHKKDIENRLLALNESRLREIQGTFVARDYQAYAIAYSELTRELGDVVKALKLLENEEERAVEHWKQIKREVDILHEVKDRRYKKFKEEWFRFEEKEINDIVNTRYMRNTENTYAIE